MEPIEEMSDTFLADYSLYQTYRNYYLSENKPKDVKSPNLELPEKFVKVLTKTIPEAVKFEVESYTVHNTYSAHNFDLIPNYLVYLTVHFDWDVNMNYSTDLLSDKINSAFNLMYTDKTNMTFRVKSIEIPKRDYEKEFFDFFIKK